MQDGQPPEVKVEVLGGAGVGKSAAVIQLVSHEFAEEYDPTLEDSYRMQIMYDGNPVLLDILDSTHCREYGELMRDLHIKNNDGFLIVYAINRRASFVEVQQIADLIKRLKELDSLKGHAVLVGNKWDLGYQREVSAEEAGQLAKNLGIPFFETSAKTGLNIEKVFTAVIGELLEQAKANSRQCLVQ